MKYLVMVLSLLSLSSVNAFAMPKDGCGGDCSSCHTLTSKEANILLKGMGGDVKQVKPAQVRGLWEVTFVQAGKQAVAYVDYGKKFIIPGPVYSIATRKPVGGGAEVPPPVTKVKVSSIPLSNSIILGNPKGTKRLILFTDPECPFCAKQHAELNKLLAKDPELVVYVKLNPLKIHPNAYDKARVILQAQSAQLLEDSYAGKPLPPPGPQTPSAGVDETMKLAQKLGLISTPSLVLPDGRVLIGFQEVAAIEKALKGMKRK